MRVKVVIFLFFLGFVAVCARLFYWQVVKGKTLAKQASYQYTETKKVTAPRGNILASDGSWLAVMRTNWMLSADIPNLTKNPQDLAETLSSYLVEDPDNDEERLLEYLRIKELLSKKEVVWVPLKRRIPTSIKEKIEALHLDGLVFEEEDIRFYPEGSSSAQLLGFVGKNEEGMDTGYFGLEGYYDLALSGKSGFLTHEKDLKGVPLLSQGVSEVSAVSGVDLLTSIDKRIQLTVEEKLKEGIEKYGAKEGSAVVMDPKTGTIMAMASYPSFDPAKYFDFTNELFKNPVISNAFEPGSVFKVVVMASALDSGAVTPETVCDICDRALKVDKYTIETWDNKYHPDSTMTEVIVHSDNVGMSFVAQKMGADTLYDYLDKFGFGKQTGIDLQGEVSSPLREKGSWNVVDLVTASFGQGIAVTPIQLLSAVATIANGGYRVIPQVVDRVKIDGWEEEITQSKKERVISEEAAEGITKMMVAAAKNGEAKWTSLSGFSVAGKTGTAQIPIAGHYDAEKTNASFVGFAPSGNPKFVMLITLREPQSSQWASETAAPLWYSIAKDLFAYFGIQPEN